MIWNGEELNTAGEFMDAVYAIEKLDSPLRETEAARFMTLYRAESPHADANVGYLSGYADPETAQRIQQLFAVEHPLIGRSSPTFEERGRGDDLEKSGR